MSMLHRARRTTAAAAVGALALLVAPASPAAAAGTGADGSGGENAVVVWNANAGEAAIAACIAPVDNPLHESRMYAMAHLAVHDALNAIDSRSAPYHWDGQAARGASPEAAVAAAAHDVLVSEITALPEPFGPPCIDAGVASVKAAYAEALAGIPDGAAEARGVAVGQQAAVDIIALRAGDGSDLVLLDFGYPQGTEPGEWRFTPDRPFAFAPGWGEVTPFGLRDADQFRPGGPYDLRSPRYTRDFREVKRLGGDDVTTLSDRTADQTEVALFWVESSPLQWNRIARTLATSQHLDLWESARMFGLLNMAMADGYVASWSVKYDERFWRPVTAIREAATDGNPRTEADPTWTPLVTTPPIPDHDSAHSVEGAAAAAVFRQFFHTNRIGFETCSLTLPEGSRCGDPAEVTRQFHSLSAAANENGESRILVGFHFRHAVEDGLDHGRDIGRWTARHFLEPVR